MPRIKFTSDPKLPRDLKHLGYRKDHEVDLPTDQADRWLMRGVAEIVPDLPVHAGKKSAASKDDAADPKKNALTRDDEDDPKKSSTAKDAGPATTARGHK